MENTSSIVDARLASISHYLKSFRESISKIDYAIEFLQDLKDELGENPNLSQDDINLYLYGSLSRLKDLKRDLSNDVGTIKNQLSLFINFDKPVTK